MKKKADISPDFPFATVRQVAKRLKISTGYVSRLAELGGRLGFFLGHSRLFLPDEIDQLNSRRRPIGRPPKAKKRGK